MTYKVYLTKPAKDDILAIHKYLKIELGLLNGADNFVDELFKACESLSFMPERFRKYQSTNKDENLRIYPIKKYLIFYRVNKECKQVEILRVLHSSRDYKNIDF